MEGHRQDAALVALNTRTAWFGRGSDVLREKLRAEILRTDGYAVFYISDFKKYGSYQRIRKAFDALAADGLVRKVGAYPVFYERVR